MSPYETADGLESQEEHYANPWSGSPASYDGPQNDHHDGHHHHGSNDSHHEEHHEEHHHEEHHHGGHHDGHHEEHHHEEHHEEHPSGDSGRGYDFGDGEGEDRDINIDTSLGTPAIPTGGASFSNNADAPDLHGAQPKADNNDSSPAETRQSTWVSQSPADVASLAAHTGHQERALWDVDVLEGIVSRKLWPTEHDFKLGILCGWDPHRSAQARSRILATCQAVGVQALLKKPIETEKLLTREHLESILSASGLPTAKEIADLCVLAEIEYSAAHKSALGPGDSYVRCPPEWVREAYQLFSGTADSH